MMNNGGTRRCNVALSLSLIAVCTLTACAGSTEVRALHPAKPPVEQQHFQAYLKFRALSVRTESVDEWSASIQDKDASVEVIDENSSNASATSMVSPPLSVPLPQCLAYSAEF